MGRELERRRRGKINVEWELMRMGRKMKENGMKELREKEWDYGGGRKDMEEAEKEGNGVRGERRGRKEGR